jgi:predicted RNase H-like nuclease (RuvC/YqgF family)
MNILQKSKIQEVVPPPPMAADLKKELKDLEGRIKEKEAELTGIDYKLKNERYSHHLAAGFGSDKGAAAKQVVINGLTEQRDQAIEELQGLNKDLRQVKTSLENVVMFEGKAASKIGDPEIRAALTELVKAIDKCLELNAGYYQLRRSFGQFPQSEWPYSCPMLDKYKFKDWLRGAKKYLEGK